MESSSKSETMKHADEPIPPLKTLLWRGCCRKCPQCGKGNIFRSWNKLHDNCAVCGLQLLENQGDLWGYILFADRAIFILPLIIMIYFRLYVPDNNWFYGIGALMIGTLIYTLPHRIGMSLALDYLVRRKSGDLTHQNDEAEK